MRKILPKLLLNGLAALGAHKLARALKRNKLVILTYHGFVRDGELPLAIGQSEEQMKIPQTN